MRNFNTLLSAVLCTVALSACSTTIDGASDEPGASGATDAGATTTPRADAQVETEPETLTLTLSTGQPVVDANINCRYGEQGPNAATQHFRVFPASDISNSRIVEAILPIEVADSPEGTQPATIKFYRLTGDIEAGEFEPISELTFDVPNQGLGEVRVPLNIAIPEDTDVVVEVAMADGEQERNLRFGHNLEAQTGPTYYASETCGPQQPIDLANLDNPFEEGETFAAHSWLISLTVERTP